MKSRAAGARVFQGANTGSGSGCKRERRCRAVMLKPRSLAEMNGKMATEKWPAPQQEDIPGREHTMRYGIGSVLVAASLTSLAVAAAQSPGSSLQTPQLPNSGLFELSS